MTSFNVSFHEAVRLLTERGSPVSGGIDADSIGSDFGRHPRDTREILGHGFRLHSARARLLDGFCRPVNPGFAFANFLWSIRPGAEAQELIRYNSRGRSFLSETGQLTCGLSERLMGTPASSPLLAALSLLEKDPSSRRSYIPLVHVSDLFKPPRDFSCFGSLHFLIRGHRLEAIATMRSQSAVGVMPYDVILLTMIQESAAGHLGLEVGSYHHICNSLHVYDDESQAAHRVLTCDSAHVELPDMAPMPAQSPLNDGTIFQQEELLRKDPERWAPSGDLDPYWNDLLLQMRDTLLELPR